MNITLEKAISGIGKAKALLEVIEKYYFFPETLGQDSATAEGLFYALMDEVESTMKDLLMLQEEVSDSK